MKKTAPTASIAGKRGKYNAACDMCAKKKIKCDGNRNVCQPCQSQGRELECTWTKNHVRKPRTEAYVEAMHKQAENLRKRLAEFRNYADQLESRLKDCPQHRNTDFRASRPSDSDGLMDDVVEPDFDINDQGSDDASGNDPAVMAICIPPQRLQVEPFTQPSRFPALAQNPADTYVLQVDGVDPSHCNPALDWSRHLPSTIPLDRPSHDKALDLLFKFFTSWCLRIIPALFLRDMYRALSVPHSQAPPRTPHYSPMLHNALVALALAFADDPKLRDLKSRQCFANYAKSFIEAECRKPNLSVVHALSVLSSFHSSQGDQTLGYMYFGMSARMSQALGLNIDFSEWVKLGIMDEADRLDRHWTNWTTFAQDVCWSLYVGRDFCVAKPIEGDTISMSHIDPEFDEMSWFYPPAKIPPQPNNLTKTFEATCRLLMIARSIMDVLNGLHKARSRPLILDSLIGDIDVKLNMWYSSLCTELEITPSSLLTATPHKLMLHLSYWWLFILLHRPFFHRKSRPIQNTDREIDHVKLCRRAAEKIMELLSTWRSLYTLRYCPITLVQTVFSAGTVYLLTAMQASSGIRIAQKELRHSLDQETLVRQYLQETGESWKCSTIISNLLRSLRDEQVMPLLDRKTIPIATADLRVPDDIGDDEEGIRASLSRSSSQGSLRGIAQLKPRHPRTITSGSEPLISPTITVSSAQESSVPIAIRSQSSSSSSSSPSSYADSWVLQPSTAHGAGSIPSLNSGPIFPSNFSSSFMHRNSQAYPQPFSNPVDHPFSGNGNGSNEDIGHAFAGQGSSFLTHNFQLSSSQPFTNHYAGAYLGMLGGQTLSGAPFVGPFSEVESHTTHDFPFQYSAQTFRTGFLNHESSSSSGEQISRADNDNMNVDLDTEPWDLEQYVVG